ncbi:MAG: hypothetical protein BAJALOKI3v1_30134 [Promethearchaeota archaeon]|jgi:hypothetical protein|nr:MAG: hypothetical protein BAJALOKI3v1_30134 [Candidatus Lokiarchaeota archaeon]
MEYRKEPYRVYSLIYHLIVIGKYHQPVCIKETKRSEALKARVLDLADNFEGKWYKSNMAHIITEIRMLLLILRKREYAS